MQKKNDDKHIKIFEKIINKNGKIRKDENNDVTNWIWYNVRNNIKITEPKWLVKLLDKLYCSDLFSETFYINLTNIRTLKKNIIIDPVNYICTIFRAYSTKENISANYTFMYSLDKKYYSILGLAKVEESPVKIMYCSRPSLSSQDGEYRNGILSIYQLKLLENIYSKIYQDIEIYLIEKNERLQLSLEYENFHPQLKIEQSAESLDQSIVNERLLMRFYIQFWLVEIYNLSIGMQENHINSKFNIIFFTDIKEDINMLKFLIEKYSQEYIDKLVIYMSTPVRQIIKTSSENIIEITNYAMGQKLRPLNVNEVQEPLNIKYSSWREIVLSQYASDLIANFISPNFAIFIDWFYIKNTKKGLFDNEQQYKKLEYSDRSELIVRKLRETQRLTYMNDWFKNKNTNKYLNDTFQILDNKIENPVEFVKSNLMMSNVTLGYIIEYVGRTFIDIPFLSKSKVWISKARDILGNKIIFVKYMFDIIYGLLSLNVKCGMIQGDLHLNNATIKITTSSKIFSKNPHALYNIYGYNFLLPHWGTYACIIDFSRGIVIPENIKEKIYIKNSDEYLEFIDDQVNRIITKYQDTFPSFVQTNKERILELIKNDFKIFFKVYSAIDIYDFAGKLEKYLTDKTLKENLLLLKKITKIAEHYLTSIMLSVLNNKDTQIEWPMFQILKECFIDNIINMDEEPKNISIIDYWEFDKPLSYSFSNYNKFPPVLKNESGMHDIKHPEKIKPIDYFEFINDHRLKYEKYRQSCMEMVNFIAQRHQDKYK